jgi:hypothetical protein
LITAPKSRITNTEATVVQKLNQGTSPQSGCNRLWVPFFGSFLGKQKRTIKQQAAIIYFTATCQYFVFFGRSRRIIKEKKNKK